ncbi:hypothetical protein [Mycobacterium intracellulare]|uniref:hypothetical protein n=1 Tax=Mycobacterium intracellulare TaxID=1767 RepID=UPI0019287B72|nr:hypothetical protein [Mycobacterium intracellulare]
MQRVFRSINKVTFDSIGTGWQGGSGTIDHHVGDGSNLILVGLSTTASGAGGASLSIGGSAMTNTAYIQYHSNGVNDSGQVQIFSMFNPPKGDITITVGLSGGLYAASANSVSYCGVHSIGAYTAATGNSSSPTQSAVNKDAHGVVFQMFGSYGNFTSYNQNKRWSINVSGNDHSCLLGDAFGIANPEFIASLSSSTVWGGIAVPLIPVP